MKSLLGQLESGTKVVSSYPGSPTSGFKENSPYIPLTTLVLDLKQKSMDKLKRAST
jgi:hypothetical protein